MPQDINFCCPRRYTKKQIFYCPQNVKTKMSNFVKTDFLALLYKKEHTQPVNDPRVLFKIQTSFANIPRGLKIGQRDKGVGQDE